MKLPELNPARYVNFAKELIQTESRFTDMYLSSEHTFIKTIETLEQVLIMSHKQALLQDFPLILQTDGTLITLFEFCRITKGCYPMTRNRRRGRSAADRSVIG